MKRRIFTGTLLCSIIISFCSLSAQMRTDLNSYIENPEVFSENEESPAALLIPYNSLVQAGSYQHRNSQYYISLNGSWKFDWKINPSLADQSFIQTDFNDKKWDEIKVPSVWQMQGYDHLMYRNVPMEFFPYDPPAVPDDINPTGCYRRTFDLPENWQSRRTFIHFYGVQSALFLWINGRYAGYHEDGMCSAEFDITSFLKPGKNLIAAMVLRWCDGSYLEDQDMFRYSGIYRDVFLYSKPATMIKDIFVKTDLDDNYENAELKMDCKFSNYSSEGNFSMRYTLFDKNKTVVLNQTTVPFPVSKKTEKTFIQKIISPEKWSDEKPYLYTLVLELIDADGKTIEITSQRVGFRDLKIKDGTAMLNGRKIYFRGTNRHEHNPDNGKTLTRELMLEDIRLLKQFNLNAVRTSHYPNDPEWYDLCDEYGILLQDEINAECHFTESVFPHRPDYLNAFLNRFDRMVQRDKNHPSVVMWSTGNECGLAEPHYKMADFIKQFDPGRFLMHQSNTPDGEAPYADIIGPRYPDPARLRQIGLNTFKPVVMGEYAHAMGNSAGHMDEFWETIYSVPRLQGGFIWDWVDQGLNIKARYVKDYSVNNIQCAVMGSPEIVKGLEGNAFKLSGLDDWIEVYDDKRLDIRSKDLTIEVSLCPQKYYQENPIVVKPFQYGIIQTDKDTLSFFLNAYNTCLKVKTPADWYYNWHKIRAVYDGKEMSIYIDENKYGSRNFDSFIEGSHYPVNIGRDSYKDNDQHLGWISNYIYDEVKIYNSSESSANASPLLWLKFDEITEGNKYFSFGASPFCINGMITADRKPQPELWQVKHSMSPVRFYSDDPASGIFRAENKYSFTNLNEFSFSWYLYKNGKPENSGSLDIYAEPQSHAEFRIPVPEISNSQDEYILDISCKVKNEETFREKGFEVNFCQFQINKPVSRINISEPKHNSNKAIISDKPGLLSVIQNGTEICVDKTTGTLDLLRNGNKIIRSMNPNIWRAPISNEKSDWGKAEAEDWYKMRLNEYVNKFETIEYMTNTDSSVVSIKVNSVMTFPKTSDLVSSEFKYIIDENGIVTINHKMTPLGGFHVEWLPCLGLKFQIADEYGVLNWYGHGPQENYSDRNSGIKIGIHKAIIDSVMNPYIEPQEYGNYSGVKWAEFSCKDGRNVKFSGAEEFNISAVPYYNLDRARYTYQLLRDNSVYVNLSYAINGVGDTPNPTMPEYRVYPRSYSNSITISVNDISTIQGSGK